MNSDEQTPQSEHQPIQPPYAPHPMSIDVEQPPVPTPFMATTPVQQSKPRRKWLFVVTIVIALAALGGGSALAAYKFWYQNPNKVVSDALMHAIEAKSMNYKGAITSTSSGATYDVSVTGAAKNGASTVDVTFKLTSGATSYNMNGSGLLDGSGNIFIKVANVDALLKGVGTQLPKATNSALDSFVKKINNQWIEISSDSLKSFSKDYSTFQQCSQNAYKKLQSDANYSSEVVTLYKTHPFIKINKELGSKDGSLGYQIIENTAEGKAFGEGLKSTKIFKMLHDCDNSIDISTVSAADTIASGDTVTTELWISRWGHEITKLTIDSASNGDKTSVTFQPSFNKDVTITAPKDAKSITQLMKDLQDLQASFIESSAQSEATTQDTSDVGLFSMLL